MMVVAIVCDRRADQLQRRLRAPGDLHEAACHSEKVHARHHRHDGGEADGCKWHVRSARDGSEDQADDNTGDESPRRDAEAEHAERDPTQGVGQHAHRDRPGQHVQRCREEDAIAGDGDAGCDHVLPQGNGSARPTNRQRGAKQHQPEQQSGRYRHDDKRGIDESRTAKMDTAVDEVDGGVEKVRSGHQHHAWADCDKAQ